MKKSPRRRARKRILMLICALVFVLCLSLLIRQYALLLQGRRARSGMQELYYGFGSAALAEEALNSDMPIAVDELRPAPAPDESFSRLLEANPDTVGWLKWAISSILRWCSATTPTIWITTSSACPRRREPPSWTRAAPSGLRTIT